MKKPPILILANPSAGASAIGTLSNARLRTLEAAQNYFQKHGHSVHIGWENEPRAIRERAQNAAVAGAPVVVAAGGDGTVNAVANGLLRASRGALCETKLGVLPLGTGNVFALNLGLGKNWRDAARIIRRGHTRRVDVGLARPLQNEAVSPRYFLLMAGLGFDAQVIEETSLRMKILLRDFAYALRTLQNAVTHRGAQITLSFDDGTVATQNGWILMAGNAASYAWAIKFTKSARLDDGILDLCLFPFENKLLSVQQVMQLLMGQHIERGTAQYFQTKRVQIESVPPIPIQLDGDEWSQTPVELSIKSGVLDVLAPKTVPETP